MMSHNIRYISKGLTLILVWILLWSSDTRAQIETNQNIMDSASQFGQIQYFHNLLEVVGMDEELNEEGPFTVFAPTDQAFQELDGDVLEAMLDNPEELRELLRAHIVSGSLQSENLATTEQITTLEGTEFRVDHHAQGMSVHGAMLVAADIIATNGIIHGIDTVLLP